MKKLNYPLACIGVILVVCFTFTWLAATNDYWLRRFNYVMFTPAPIAALFLFLQTKSLKALLAPIIQPVRLKALLFAVVYPLVIIFACALTAQSLGLATIHWEKLAEIKMRTPIQLLWAFGFLFGEEYAWRGYLLPYISKQLGPIKATAIVGVVWAIWHGPLVYLLATRLATWDSPLMLACVQMFVVLIFSFPFAYSYDLSKSVFPPILLHFTWNWMNQEILGNIYRNTPGITEGSIFIINGEGLMGAIFGLFFMVWYILRFRQYSTAKVFSAA